ncbi:MAG TPA: helix-turn-helix domain-containing protein [Acidimicrobiales bacterium]
MLSIEKGRDEEGTQGPEPRPRGRPRDPRVDAAVRRATVELLRREGYAGLTIEGVARRAGVGPASVYRRWPSKAYLVHELVFPDEQRFAPPPGGRLDEVVRALVAGVVASLSRPEALAAIPGLMAEYGRDADLRRRLQDRFEPDAKATLRRAVEAAAARGEARPDAAADADTLFDAVLGTVVVAVFVTERGVGRPFVDRLVALLLDGLRPHPQPDSRPGAPGRRRA